MANFRAKDFEAVVDECGQRRPALGGDHRPVHVGLGWHRSRYVPLARMRQVRLVLLDLQCLRAKRDLPRRRLRAVEPTIPLALAATSDYLAWRDPVYVAAGLAGVVALRLLLVQPLLACGWLHGISLLRGRRIHRELDMF